MRRRGQNTRLRGGHVTVAPMLTLDYDLLSADGLPAQALHAGELRMLANGTLVSPSSSVISDHNRSSPCAPIFRVCHVWYFFFLSERVLPQAVIHNK